MIHIELNNGKQLKKNQLTS